MPKRYLIVEGTKDKQQLERLLDHREVEIICTNGTLSEERLEYLSSRLDGEDVTILVDADQEGNKLRTQLKQELPNAQHIFTRRMYREVSDTPIEYLIDILNKAYFNVIPSLEPPPHPKSKLKRNRERYK
jgi:toprim domain protein